MADPQQVSVDAPSISYIRAGECGSLKVEQRWLFSIFLLFSRLYQLAPLVVALSYILLIFIV